VCVWIVNLTQHAKPVMICTAGREVVTISEVPYRSIVHRTQWAAASNLRQWHPCGDHVLFTVSITGVLGSLLWVFSQGKNSPESAFVPLDPSR
jgi:hypothetical protein